MFTDALDRGRRLGLLATFPSSVASMAVELRKMDSRISLKTACVPEAMAALKAGDGARHDALLASAALELVDCDAVMLAQFSTARARDAVSAVLRCPVLASPDSAVLRMRRLVG
jgi:hypothetical protein